MNTPKTDDALAPPTASSAVGWRQRSHDAVTPHPAAVRPSSEPVRPRADAAARAVVHSAVLLLIVVLLLLIQRLPWNGDLGLHAATIERLRADLLHPGSPQVDADTDSPYYSPWTVLLALVAKATGANSFTVLRIAALITLPLLLTGIRHFTRTLSTRRLAPPLAVLCLLLLWGPPLLAWSGFLELGSLALVISYPSTFVVALSFHFWALLTKALRTAASWKAFLGLGLMWAVIMLSHQFSGVVATFGALAVARHPARHVRLPPGARRPPRRGQGHLHPSRRPRHRPRPQPLRTGHRRRLRRRARDRLDPLLTETCAHLAETRANWGWRVGHCPR